MKNKLFFPNDPYYGLKYINNKEIKAANEVMRSKGLFRFDGPKLLNKTDELENKFSKMFNEHALCVDNGTSALKLCLISNDIGIGDEVLVPCISFIASASCILTVGALPIFVDVDSSFNIDISKANNLITKQTKAIIVVHFQGFPCDMDKINEFAKKFDLVVIEDVAQAFGTKYKNQLTGTFGDAAAFSFQSGKVITSGEGGLFICKDYEKFKKAKRYADCGGERAADSYPIWDKPYISFGENFKITEIQSAILLEQFKKLDTIYNNQIKNYNYIIENIEKSTIYKVRECYNESSSFPMSLCFIFNSVNQKNKFISFMNDKGIEFFDKMGNFLPDYNCFKNKVSCYSTGFPFNSDYKVNKCLQSRSLLEKTCWINLSAYIKKCDLRYLIKNIKDCNNEEFYS